MGGVSRYFSKVYRVRGRFDSSELRGSASRVYVQQLLAGPDAGTRGLVGTKFGFPSVISFR